MKCCEVCGNEYANLFEIKKNNASHWFDCFECAIHKLAPQCDHCGVKILCHGMESDDQLFCGAHCARLSGIKNLMDNTIKRPFNEAN